MPSVPSYAEFLTFDAGNVVLAAGRTFAAMKLAYKAFGTLKPTSRTSSSIRPRFRRSATTWSGWFGPAVRSIRRSISSSSPTCSAMACPLRLRSTPGSPRPGCPAIFQQSGIPNRQIGLSRPEQCHAGSELEIIWCTEDLPCRLAMDAEHQLGTFQQPLPQNGVSRIRGGLRQRSNPILFGDAATSELLELWKDEPYPVRGLVTGAQFFEPVSVFPGVGLDESLELERVGQCVQAAACSWSAQCRFPAVSTCRA